jgi:protocatechuate 3,4-dioxygenase beta subunit
MSPAALARRVFVATLVALATTAASRAQISVGPPPRPGMPTAVSVPGADASGLITGRVIDGTTDAPVGSVLVVLIGDGQTEFNSPTRVLTDADGRFYFGSLTPGRYTLAASKAGWMPGVFGRLRPAGPSQPIELRDHETRADVTVRTWRYAVVSGRVTDEAAEPVISADVFIYQRTFAAGRAQFVFSARAITDDLGIFRFSSLSPGHYIVVVPATVISEPSAQPRNNDSYLRTMTGLGAAPIFRDDVGVQAGSGSLVTSALNVRGAPPATGAWTTYTSTMAPSATTLDAAQTVTATAGRETAGIDVQVRYVSTYRVSGTLTDDEGRPANAHALHLLPADMADYPILNVATAVTDPAGNFTFLGVPQGSYVARVVRIPVVQGGRISRCGGTGELPTVCTSTFGPNGPLTLSNDPLLYGEESVAVGDRDVTGLSIGMRTGARMSGRVEFDGTAPPLTDAQLARIPITLEAAGGQLSRAPGRAMDTAQLGQFLPDSRFATPSTLPGAYLLRVGVLPAPWTVKSAMAQGRDISQSAVSLTSDLSDVVITLTDRPAKIEGTVQDLDKVAGSGAVAILFPADEAGWVDYGQTSRRVQSAAVSDGRFSMLAPPEGAYFLAAISDETASEWQNPAFLRRLVAVASHITVTGTTSSVPLRVRRVP